MTRITANAPSNPSPTPSAGSRMPSPMTSRKRSARLAPRASPDAELSSALRDGKMEHAVNTNHRKRQRREGERRHEPRLQPALGGQVAEHVLHGLDLQENRTGIRRLDRFAYRGAEQRGIGARSDDNVHGRFAAGEEEFGNRTGFQTVTVHVADNSNDAMSSTIPTEAASVQSAI